MSYEPATFNEEWKQHEAIVQKVRAFLAKYDALEPHMISAFQIAAVHGCGYDGSAGNWGEELKALREAVK